MMPKRLVLVRHGQSEGNLTHRLIEAGQKHLIPPEIMDIPRWQWRLTPKGRNQAKYAGAWIRSNIPVRFDRGFVSWYIRALETAGYLDISEILWRPSWYIRERDYGTFDAFPPDFNEEEYRRRDALRKVDRAFWSPEGGESIAQALHRVDRINFTLHRDCEQENVIAVMHGETMWALRIIYERLSPQEFQDLANSDDEANHIRNCQILEYTRIDPFTDNESTQFTWMRSICPWDPPTDLKVCWKPLVRQKLSTGNLLDLAEQYPTIYPTQLARELEEY
jgi:broad specificity phosphatase PhoE